MLCYKTLKFYGKNNFVKVFISRGFSNFRGSYKVVNRGSPEGSDGKIYLTFKNVSFCTSSYCSSY